jgi:hypothetical protein
VWGLIVGSAKRNTDPIKALELPNSPVPSAAWTLVFTGPRRVRAALSACLCFLEWVATRATRASNREKDREKKGDPLMKQPFHSTDNEIISECLITWRETSAESMIAQGDDANCNRARVARCDDCDKIITRLNLE